MDEPLLRLEKVTRTYTMGEVSVPVLREVSLQIGRGELLAIVGPSGSGKTTILNLIGGLDRPTSGRVWYESWDLSRADDRTLTRYRREHVGFVFQFYNLVPNLTARENVLAAAEICETPRDVDEVLELVGLSDRRQHFPSQLSGGEQQRVAIARAVAKNPDLLLCDEPTGALDLKTGRNVLRLLVDLNRDLGKTIVVITHNAALAQVAHRVIHLGSGEVHDVVENLEPTRPEEVSW
jgi:putative ABC transport system ATP-binding protein